MKRTMHQKQNSSSLSKPKGVGAGICAVPMARRSCRPRDAFLRRLRHYYLFTKLRSLLPTPPPTQLITSKFENLGGVTEKMMTKDIPLPDEIPDMHLDDENTSETSLIPTTCEEEEEDNVTFRCRSMKSMDDSADDDNEDVMNTVDHKAFSPSIKVKRLGSNSLLISTIVSKDVALLSSLFHLLEQEKELNIIFEHQYRTKTKVSHTIQVRLLSRYDADALQRKLLTWARTGSP